MKQHDSNVLLKALAEILKTQQHRHLRLLKEEKSSQETKQVSNDSNSLQMILIAVIYAELRTHTQWMI